MRPVEITFWCVLLVVFTAACSAMATCMLTRVN